MVVYAQHMARYVTHTKTRYNGQDVCPSNTRTIVLALSGIPFTRQSQARPARRAARCCYTASCGWLHCFVIPSDGPESCRPLLPS
jgi:hypothetical protein